MGRTVADPRGPLASAAVLAERLTQAHYVVIVHDAEPAEQADPQRSEGLIGLAQALNIPTRCALSTLRGGGNRSGADAAMTWQTGYPFAVNFALVVPRYRADEPASEVVAQMRAVLIAGEWRGLPPAFVQGLAGRVVVAIGPRASEVASAEVAVDTGMAGIHEAGTAYRLDDVPLPLTPALSHPQAAAAVLDAIAGQIARRSAVLR